MKNSLNRVLVLLIIFLINPYLLLSKGNFWNNYAFEIAHSPSFYFNSIKVFADKNSILENVDISLYNQLSKNFSVGISYKKEQFYLKYINKEVIEVFDVHKHLSVQNINAHFRYYIFEILEKMKLFGRISLGGNNYGLIARESFGIKYMPLKHGYFIFPTTNKHRQQR